MIVFVDGKPEKVKNIVNGKIKTVQGPDRDYSLHERSGSQKKVFRSIKKKALPLPDFIVVDGGKGHLAAVQGCSRKNASGGL